MNRVDKSDIKGITIYSKIRKSPKLNRGKELKEKLTNLGIRNQWGKLAIHPEILLFDTFPSGYITLIRIYFKTQYVHLFWNMKVF